MVLVYTINGLAFQTIGALVKGTIKQKVPVKFLRSKRPFFLLRIRKGVKRPTAPISVLVRSLGPACSVTAPTPQRDRRIASLPNPPAAAPRLPLPPSSVPCSAADTLARLNLPMAAAASATAISGVVLPHAFLSHRSPPPQVLAVASSLRRLSLCASPRRTTHIIARADASAEAGEPETEEPVTSSAESEEEVAEGAVAVAEAEEEEAEEPPPPSKPKVKFGEIIGVRISCTGSS